MAFEPRKITKEHVLEAVKKIEDNKIQLTPSTIWNVEIKGKKYPPKEVMRYAHEQMNGEKEWHPGGGPPTNRYLEYLGFKITEKGTGMQNNLSNEEETPFSSIIEELQTTLAKDESILNQFSFGPVSKDKSDDYVWIKDATKTIGNLSAHYEILFSHQVSQPSYYYVDIHFEDKNKKIFLDQLKSLPPNCEWIKWYQAKRIRYKGGVDSKDPHLVEKLRDQLLYVEQNLGDKIRSIMKQSSSTDPVTKAKVSLNQILYGPPGTGKTYNTVNRALKIINEDDEKKLNFNDREAVKKQFDKRVEEGRIVFTTFHQSMSYEDFIEGIKPLKPKGDKPLQYEIKDGLFKSISLSSFNELIGKNREERNYYRSTFEELHSEFLKSIQPFVGKDEYIFKTLYGHDIKLKEIKGSTIIVIFRWQDSKKTIAATQPFSVTKEKLRILFEAGIDPKTIKSLKESFSPYFQHNLSVYYAVYKKFYEFVQSKTGNKEIEEVEVSDALSFDDLKEEWLMQLEEERKVAKETAPSYVIIIDEINRGNVSQIFGELITLIEEDKRIGEDEALEAILPYSKHKFGVPPNLYIIGTMNTADRSVEALDAALRRRFEFEEMIPRPELVSSARKIWELLWNYQQIKWEDLQYKSKENNLFELLEINSDDDAKIEKIWNRMEKEGKSENQIHYFNEFSAKGINLETLLYSINNRIEKLLDKDHQIGHSYFIKVNSIGDLKNAFYNKIIPLLQEYFFGDYGKIGLVLGNGFVKRKEWDKKTNSFADFDYESANSFEDRDVFEIIDYRENVEQEIKYKNEKRNIKFEQAVKLIISGIL